MMSRYEERTRLLVYLHPRLELLEAELVAVGIDGRRGADNADPAVARDPYGGVCGGIDNARIRHWKGFPEQIARDGADGAAGGDDHLYVVLQKEIGILNGVFSDRIAAAGTVGHPARIAEVYYLFLRKNSEELLDGAQASETRVKNADRVL